MTDWPFGVGDARRITVLINGQRSPSRGERVYFDQLDANRIVALDITRHLLGEVLDESTRLRLRHTLERRQDYVAEVESEPTSDGRWQAVVSWPVEVIRLPGPIQVVLSSKARRQMAARLSKQLEAVPESPELASGEPELISWLAETFIYQNNYLVFARIPDRPDQLALLSPLAQLHCEIRRSSFLWAASGGNLPKEREATFSRAGLIDARAEWRLSKSELPEVAEGALSLLETIAAKSEYFAIWHDYHNLEQNMLVSRYAAVKPLNYRRLKYYDDVVRFFIEPGSDTAAWRDMSGGLSVELVTRPARRRRQSDVEEAVKTLPLGTVRRIQPDYIDVDRSDDEPGLPDRGQLRVSARGDVVRLTRQQAALEQLMTGQLPLPKLQALLSEGKTEDIRIYSVLGFTTQPPRMADRTKPNDRQEKAVRMALNTPDICVIQGPPGTGKTSVIRTILRRLKEEGRRHLLVSSHQHTAVDNVLNSLSDCGVVAYRFGGNEESENYRNDELEAWTIQVTQGIQSQLAKLPQTDEQYGQRLRLKELVEQATGTPMSLSACEDFLLGTSAKYAAVLPEPLARQAQILHTAIRAYLKVASVPSAPVNLLGLKEVRRAVEALPTDAGQLHDLKPLGELRVKLEQLLKEGQGDTSAVQEYKRQWSLINLLQPSVRLSNRSGEALTRLQAALDGAHQAAQRFMNRCWDPQEESKLPAELPSEDYWRSQFQQWCREVARSVNEAAESGASQVAVILRQWLDTINNRPAQVKQLFSKHADVWGVTCQQSVARRFGLYEEEFDCVVVDEAARTSPLDLLIPLVRARRIVLVGDHKQLPHVLDYQLEKEFEVAAKRPELKQALKDSLFARLYDQLPESKRVRLKVQYRMHPVIGRMVSEVFYQDDPLEHAPSTEALVNDTGLFGGRSLVWLNTTTAAALGQGETGQYSNPLELELVLKCVRKLLEQDKPYSIGIITYYAQQRDMIQRALGDRVPKSQRVHVGSVDAFQGEQKDIIILSLVRSNLDRRIGFLHSPNRINVSLSRARRLLVLIGDADTVTVSPYLKSVFQYCRQINSVVSQVSVA